MIKTAIGAALLCLVAAVPGVGLAQPPTDPAAPDPAATAPPDTADRDRAIVNGKRVQPHTAPGESAKSPEDQIRLLKREATQPPSEEPIVAPRDFYGRPLGGNPGLPPPALTPQPPPAGTPPKG
jgi:hypothetical protein